MPQRYRLRQTGSDAGTSHSDRCEGPDGGGPAAPGAVLDPHRILTLPTVVFHVGVPTSVSQPPF